MLLTRRPVRILGNSSLSSLLKRDCKKYAHLTTTDETRILDILLFRVLLRYKY